MQALGRGCFRGQGFVEGYLDLRLMMVQVVGKIEHTVSISAITPCASLRLKSARFLAGERGSARDGPDVRFLGLTTGLEHSLLLSFSPND